MKKIYSKSSLLTLTVSVMVGVLVVMSGVSAATTISTNIVTGGNLTVTGNSSLTGTLGVTGASTLTGGVTVGAGTAITEILKGSCTSFNGNGANSIDGSHAASTTRAYDCAVTGVEDGDLVFAQLATSTANGSITWLVAGAKASTTDGYITVMITNYGAAAVPSATGVGSSTSYLIIR